jgi:predicted ATP-grasp superfamily ATP-dependent carboligase
VPAVLIGFNEQWTDPGEPQQPYRFAGGLQPAAVNERLRRDVAELLDGIVREFGLVGLNSLDVIDEGANYWILEVNPRPGANLDVYDSSGTAGLFARHIAACEGRLPDGPLALAPASAMSILYAARHAGSRRIQIGRNGSQTGQRRGRASPRVRRFARCWPPGGRRRLCGG